MEIIKIIILFLIFASCSVLGLALSKRYVTRVKELKKMKNALNILKTKIKFTMKPIGDIFIEIAENSEDMICDIFKNASIKMKNMTAGKAWNEALEESNTNMLKEDKEILKTVSKMLGKTDIEGQISEINLTITFLDTQIEKAQIICNKNEKMYRKLGTIIGLALVIMLL